MVKQRFKGQPHEICDLGARIVVGRNTPTSPVDGEALLREAAAQGCAEAWGYLSVLAASGVGRSQSWSDALDYLNTAATQGASGAQKNIDLLRTNLLGSAEAVNRWLNTAPTSNELNVSPPFSSHSEFIPADFCRHLMRTSESRLKRAQVRDAKTGHLKIDLMRTNSSAAYSLIDTDLIFQLIRARIAQLAQVNVSQLEPSEILHYSVGEQYQLHIDFYHASRSNYAEEMRIRGQRIKTCLIYLNQNYEGGSTAFPQLNLRFRGLSGEALLFSNVDDQGAGHMKTIHAGEPVIQGKKWIFSKWIRDKAQLIS